MPECPDGSSSTAPVSSDTIIQNAVSEGDNFAKNDQLR